MSSKKVTNIILNWNSAEDTIRLLGLLSKQTYSNLNTIVVDNKSTDESVLQIAPYATAITFIKNENNLGYAHGNNIGINNAIRAQAEYIWILNPDIRPEPETLTTLVYTLDNDPSIGAIGPRICFIDNPDKIYSEGGLIFPEKGFLAEHKNNNRYVSEVSSNQNYDVDYVNGSAILIRTSTLNDIGLFLEDFFLYYEEAEWCLRAKKRGWRIVCNNNAVVYHKSSRKGFRYHFFMGRNRIILSKILNRYLIQSLKTELKQTIKVMGKPHFFNLLFSLTRIAGIVNGLTTVPDKKSIASIHRT